MSKEKYLSILSKQMEAIGKYHLDIPQFLQYTNS